MTRSDEGPERSEIPNNWDVIRDTVVEGDDGDAPEAEAVFEGSACPPKINLLAASWADAVVVLAVCTAALLCLNAAGHQENLIALPWAATLGLVWWTAAAAILVTIRQGTPGMLLAGVHFSGRIAPRRVGAVVVAAALSSVLVGLPGLLGARLSPLALAGGSALESVPVD
jgi:hypothetical protein